MTKFAITVGSLSILIVVLLAPASLSAQETDAPYMEQIDQFFAKLAENKGDEAILAVHESSPYAALMADAINNVAIQLAAMQRTYGEYRDHEILIHEVVLERYAYLMFFVSYDRQPFKFEFHFYKPTDDWQFQNFRFSDEVDDDIVEAARLKLLRYEGF